MKNHKVGVGFRGFFWGGSFWDGFQLFFKKGWAAHLQKPLSFSILFQHIFGSDTYTQKHRGKCDGIPFIWRGRREGSVQLATGSFLWLASRMLPWLVAFADWSVRMMLNPLCIFHWLSPVWHIDFAVPWFTSKTYAVKTVTYLKFSALPALFWQISLLWHHLLSSCSMTEPQASTSAMTVFEV